jgi:hypothetical protein
MPSLKRPSRGDIAGGPWEDRDLGVLRQPNHHAKHVPMTAPEFVHAAPADVHPDR